ncbi:hypothetical protein [Actinomadura fulvescens]|uniref:hypothetical protein n=1 Tax=Actinomadura fulvescens TaxID=46160 RepID=UPI00397BFEE8
MDPRAVDLRGVDLRGAGLPRQPCLLATSRHRRRAPESRSVENRRTLPSRLRY